MDTLPAASVARLDVEREPLREGLKQLARHIGKGRAEDAILRFEDDALEVRIGGGRIRAPATGRWPIEVRVPGSFLVAIAKHLPQCDPVSMHVLSGRFHLAGTSIGCSWQKVGAAEAQIPIDASLIEILRIGSEYTDDALERSGILARVNEARAERERRIEKALTALAPLGVRHADLLRIVDARVGGMRSRPDGAGEDSDA